MQTSEHILLLERPFTVAGGLRAVSSTAPRDVRYSLLPPSEHRIPEDPPLDPIGGTNAVRFRFDDLAPAALVGFEAYSYDEHHGG